MVVRTRTPIGRLLERIQPTGQSKTELGFRQAYIVDSKNLTLSNLCHSHG